MTEIEKDNLRENGLYVPLYDEGDVLANSDGTKVTIVYICEDQYRMKVEGEELDRYEYCEHVDYWYCPVKSLKEHQEEVMAKLNTYCPKSIHNGRRFSWPASPTLGMTSFFVGKPKTT